MPESVYMMVSDDEYELPVFIADSVVELAEFAGVKRSAVSSAISHAKKKGFKSIYVKVVLDEERKN